MPIGSASPPYTNKNTDQKELSSLSDEEFHTIVEDPKYTWYQRLFKVLSFLIFLGPIRIVVGTIGFLSCCFLIDIIMWIDIKLLNNWQIHKAKVICRYIGRLGFLMVNFVLGVMYYKVHGKIDPEARFFICNHTTLIDPFVFIIFSFYTPVIKKEVSKIKIFKYVLEDAVDCVYVDRDKHYGQSQTIIDRANDMNCSPVLIYPEGTIAGGNFMLKFHKTAFITDYKVQPVAMRYCSPLVPEGWNTYSWKKASLWQHLWNMVSMPPSYVTLDILPTMTKAVDGEGDVEKFALNAELAIANHLGLRATNRSSHEIYLKKKEAKEDTQEKEKKD